MATTPATNGVHVHTAWRSDVLATALADVLATPLPDPFGRDVISVPTPGVERWLSQVLSTALGATGSQDGVSAGIEFPTLSRLIHDLIATATGVDPGEDPWRPGRLVWHVLAAMDAARDEPWFALVAEHLNRDTSRPGRRFRTAQRLARLFHSYAEQRPQLLVDWSRGVDDVPTDLVWQPMLWRAVRDRIGSDPSQRLTDAVHRLSAEPDLVNLPHRLSVFGPTRLSATEVALLNALGVHRTVHLWLPHPSPAAAAHVATDPLGPRPPALPDADLHPLVRRLGRDSLELSRVLTQISVTHHHHESSMPAGSLLHTIQADVVAGRTPGGNLHVTETDQSVEFHACHGSERQVEVLRETVLRLLADDPGLEPRDIVVMCPDIERWAPQISALFDGAENDGEPHHPVHRIPVRLADRSLRQVNPILAVLEQLFDLVHDRSRASSLLALCAAAPVARRFRFATEDLDTVAHLVDRARVRWGIDRADLQRHGMGDFTQNTWLVGLDRLLVGIALPSDQPVAAITPVDVNSSSNVGLIGRLAELITRVRRISADFATPKSLAAWTVSMRRALELLTEVAAGDDWQVNHAFATIADLADAADDDGPELTSADMAELLGDAFRGRPSRASFRTGALTVCTMSPMRSVPHKVVVLLGLDDGAFPRATRTNGDDLLGRDPREGERDRATEDRQLLLDAVLSATDKLVVIRSGRDELSNRAIPMAIPLADLHETCTATLEPDSRRRWASQQPQHPLQPFSPGNFDPSRPRSFDNRALAGARALIGPRQSEPLLVDVRATLPPLPTESVELSDLISMLTNPLQHFLRARGVLTSASEIDPHAEQISARLDGLQNWGLQARVLDALRRGMTPDDILRQEAWSGELPPFELGRQALTTAINEMGTLLRSAGPDGALAATPHLVAIDLPDSLLGGAVPVVNGGQLLVSPSKSGWKHHIELWVNHLALCANADVNAQWRSRAVCHPASFRFRRFSFSPIPSAEARDLLADLVTLYRTGLQRVLPLPGNLALDWMVRDPNQPFMSSKSWRFEKAPWREYYSSPQDLWEGLPPEDSEFGELAQRVLGPLLARREQP